jgi:hypothetical protein
MENTQERGRKNCPVTRSTPSRCLGIKGPIELHKVAHVKPLQLVLQNSMEHNTAKEVITGKPFTSDRSVPWVNQDTLTCYLLPSQTIINNPERREILFEMRPPRTVIILLRSTSGSTLQSLLMFHDLHIASE